MVAELIHRLDLPLAVAIGLAGGCTFLAGYITGVMLAPRPAGTDVAEETRMLAAIYLQLDRVLYLLRDDRERIT